MTCPCKKHEQLVCSSASKTFVSTSANGVSLDSYHSELPMDSITIPWSAWCLFLDFVLESEDYQVQMPAVFGT